MGVKNNKNQPHIFWGFALLTLLFTYPASFAHAGIDDLFPLDRRIVWQGNVGVEGGIPVRNTIFAILDPAAFGNGTNGASDAIEAALNGCPDNQVVFLPAGVYRVDKTITLTKSNVTLRGAGAGKTILLADDVGTVVMFGREAAALPALDIVSGYTKGSTQLVLQNAGSIAVGAFVTLDELNDPAIPVSNTGVGACTWCGRDNGNRVRGQLVKVVAKNGNTITIDPSLYYTFSAPQQPQVLPLGGNLPSRMSVEFSGIEDLTIRNNWRPSRVRGTDGREYSAFKDHTSSADDQPTTGSGWKWIWQETNRDGSSAPAWQPNTAYNGDYKNARIPISAALTANCWVKGVKVERSGSRCIYLFYNNFRFEIRDSYISKCINRQDSNNCYGTLIGWACSGILVENNVYESTADGPLFAWGASGNVVAYNYMFDTRRTQNAGSWFTACGGSHHGAHTAFNLWEGNKLETIYVDDYWGSHSHNTLFRNRILGAYMVDGIVTNEPYMQNIIAIATEKDVTYQNYLGNMLGKDNYHDVYERNAEGCPNGFYDKLIYRTGYNSSGSCDSSHNAWNTLFRHMNYDTVSRSVKYCDSPGEPGCQGSSGDHQLPDSFYLTSKPSWWGDLTWPPFGPDPATADNKIPAQLRFENLPAIENFTANPAVIVQGQSSALSWIVTAADSLSIDHGLGTMSGTSTIVSPTATTTYKLTATNSTGSSTADVTVMVQGSGGGSSGVSGGGGGGGGCFITAASSGTLSGLPMLILLTGILGLIGFMIMRHDHFQLSRAIKGIKRREPMKTLKLKLILTISAAVFLLSVNTSVLAGTYWVSNNGAAAWSACQSATPLSGTSCCNLATANTNAAAGDTIYLRGGIYTVNSIYGAAISPSHSGTCASPPCTGGVGAGRIEFAAYTGETPVITQANMTNIMMGIRLNGISWIKVTGITFKNFTYYLAFIQAGASYNEFSYCSFIADAGYESPGAGFIVGQYDGLSGWSIHNWIHHNYFSKKQNSNPCGEAADMIRLGNAETNPWSADNNNTIEYNYVEYAGHATLVTYSLNNVISNNIFHNEPFIAGCTNWQTSTSESSVSIGICSKSFSTQAGVAGYTAGQPIAIIAASDYSQSMNGIVTSYNSSTGALVVNVAHSTGSGTYNSWILSQGNIPYYENASYNGLYGHRNIGLGDENHFVDNHNLAEGNRLGFSSVNPGNAGSSNLDFESPGNIGRHNFVYGGMDSGIYFKWANTPTWGNGTGGVRNHVYNNTVYHNGHGWNPAAYGGKSLAYNGQGIAQLNYSSTVNSNNVIKNNLVYDNSQGDICELGWYGNSNCTAKTYDIVVNNWLTTNGDPKFINADLTDPTSQNLFPSVHGYNATPIPDLGLQASSPAINGGAYLTQANGAGANSTTLVVDDAGYFQDGTWGSDLARGVTFFADWIAIGTVTNAVQISSINYATNTITLALPMTWSDGANIWLYKNSSGRIVLFGSAPDMGAYEYVPGLYLSSPRGGEIWVQGFSHAITWSSSGVTEPVKIELFKASTLQWDVTVPFGSGTSEWQIPTNQTVGDDYSIKISAGSYSDTSDSFTIAAPAAPDVNTLAAQSVTTSSALLRGTVHPMGLSTTYYFEYGPTTAYGYETSEEILAAGDVETAVQAPIAGLNASTIYYFRLVATNSAGTTYGDDLTFATSGGGGAGGGESGGGGGCFIATTVYGSVLRIDLSALFLFFLGIVLTVRTREKPGAKSTEHRD